MLKETGANLILAARATRLPVLSFVVSCRDLSCFFLCFNRQRPHSIHIDRSKEIRCGLTPISDCATLGLSTCSSCFVIL